MGQLHPRLRLLVHHPAIIEGLGYTSAVSQLLTVPLYTAGVISVISLSLLADKKQCRWKLITFPYLVSAAGLIALLAIPHPKYVLFL